MPPTSLCFTAVTFLF